MINELSSIIATILRSRPCSAFNHAVAFYPIIALIIFAYVVAAELVKRLFHRANHAPPTAAR
jgi:sterol desaturase/sphingolipid hydroxylase (fatty acid hydroxylase superfamily)